VFIGHYAVGLAAKRAAPSISLGTLFLACQAADILWPTLLVLGVERVEIRPGDTAVTPLAFTHYPYSHSLAGMVLIGVALAAVTRLRSGSARSATIVGAVAVSHWVLDAVTHRPDLPLTFTGATRVGLGLWYSLPWTVAVEGAMFAAALAAYIRGTRATTRAGSIGFWALIGALLLVYVANVLGPPPPSTAAIAWGGHALWLPPLWAHWVDRHRVMVR